MFIDDCYWGLAFNHNKTSEATAVALKGEMSEETHLGPPWESTGILAYSEGFCEDQHKTLS